MGVMRLHQIRSAYGDIVPRRALGDPGFFGFLGHVAQGVTNIVKATPIGGIAEKVVTTGEGFLKKHKKGIAVGAAAGATGLAAVIAGKLGRHGIAARAGAGAARRYRRMNPMNYRALKRATRRIHSAKKLYSTIFHQVKYTHVPKRLPKGLRSGHRRRAAA